MRKIVYVTGSRSEYGVMRSTLKAINADPQLELSLIVTGAHLMPKYGSTVKEIQHDGFKIAAKVPLKIKNESGIEMAKYFSDCVIGVAKALEKIRPDIFIIQSDRSEDLASAVAAAYLNIPIVHMSGGDVTSGGTIDDSIRHATSKFAHIHFPSTEESARRLVRLMEEPQRIYYVGNPSVDLSNEKYTAAKEIAKKFSFDLKKPILVMIFHPVKSEVGKIGKNTEEIIEALKQLKMQTVILYPNCDVGSDEIIKVVERNSKLPFVRVVKTIHRDEFIGLLRVASAMIGNSSCAVIEAPSLKLPAVNIGPRQRDRERSNNLIDVGYDRNEIAEAIKKAVFDKRVRARYFRNSIRNTPYAKEGTEKRVVEILKTVKLDGILVKKCYEGSDYSFNR
jgi:UDP-hydrolysing UDP-N-acetyl-D-glucosamine 2-epimerase